MIQVDCYAEVLLDDQTGRGEDWWYLFGETEEVEVFSLGDHGPIPWWANPCDQSRGLI